VDFAQPNRAATLNLNQTYQNAHLMTLTSTQLPQTDLERRLREAELFIRINTAAAELSPISVLNTVCREVAEALGVPSSGFGQIDRTDGTMTVIAEHRSLGPSALGQKLERNDLTLEVIRERHVVIVKDVVTEPLLSDGNGRERLLALGIRSLMIVPVIARGEVIGTLGLDAYEPHAFSEEDAELARSVVRTAASALEMTRLFEQLQHSVERYERLVAGIDGVVWESTWDGEKLACTYVSPHIETLLGYPASSFLGFDDENSWPKIHHSTSRNTVIDALQNVAEHLVRRDIEYRVISRDGREIWIADSFSGWRQDGTIFLRGLMRDITAQKRAVRLELQRNEVLELIAHNAPLEVSLERLRGMAETELGGAPNAVIVFDESDFEMVNIVGLPASVRAVLEGSEGQAFLLRFAEEKKLLRSGEVIKRNLEDPRVSDATRAAMKELPQQVSLLPISSSRGDLLAAMLVFHHDNSFSFSTELRAVTDLLSIAIERSKLLSALEFQATHDQLTRLPNRMLYNQRLEAAILETTALPGRAFGLLSIDLDGFKAINDRYGHSVGDELLVALASSLKKYISPGNTLARLGGDEFVIILRNVATHDECAQIAERIRRCANEFRLSNGAGVSASVGTALYPHDATTAEDLYRIADASMYLEKRGRSAQKVY
jgi:diguanylate cyclase (GGDEF)-like protein/PAS domain S-box-containing protein